MSEAEDIDEIASGEAAKLEVASNFFSSHFKKGGKLDGIVSEHLRKYYGEEADEEKVLRLNESFLVTSNMLAKIKSPFAQNDGEFLEKISERMNFWYSFLEAKLLIFSYPDWPNFFKKSL